MSGLFLLGYGTFRLFCEFFRQPDAFAGFIAFGWVTLGMAYSAPMIIAGIIMLIWAYTRTDPNKTDTRQDAT